MPRSATTGVFTRVSNSFSNPVFGTLIDPTDAEALFDDQDVGLNPAELDGPVRFINSLQVGTTGTAAGTVDFLNATSGSITIAPPTGALGTRVLTLPIATDTLVGKDTTDVLNNKSMNSPVINGGVISSLTTLSTTGDATVGAILRTGGDIRVTAQFDKTSSTTFSDITGLSVTLTAGLTYGFQANLYTSSNAASGVKASVAGTATATAVTFTGAYLASAGFSSYGRATALGGAIGGVTAVTDAEIVINGTITVNAGGTLTIQFAQNVSGGVASSVLVGSTMQVWKIA